jgi:hypothetical protein
MDWLQPPTRGLINAYTSRYTFSLLYCGSARSGDFASRPLSSSDESASRAEFSSGPKTLCNKCGVRYRKGLPLKKSSHAEAAENRAQVYIAHGGGRRCQHDGCEKGAVGGGTPFCIAHGGGRRCQHDACTKGAQVQRCKSCEFTYRVWHGATEKWSLNDGQIQKPPARLLQSCRYLTLCRGVLELSIIYNRAAI